MSTRRERPRARSGRRSPTVACRWRCCRACSTRCTPSMASSSQSTTASTRSDSPRLFRSAPGFARRARWSGSRISATARCRRLCRPPWRSRVRTSRRVWPRASFATSPRLTIMDAELASWREAGQYFDYLGFDIFYRVSGSGPPLLLIHGYPFNSFDWAPIWPTLTQRFTVIAPDMMGMGFSAKPVAYEYSVHDHADMHEALLEHLGIGNAHILAHDLGDSVGQELLARHEFRQHA